MSTPPNPPSSPAGPPTEPAGTSIPEAAPSPGPSPSETPEPGPSLTKEPTPTPTPGPSLTKEATPTPGPSLTKEPTPAEAPAPEPVDAPPAPAPAAPPVTTPPVTTPPVTAPPAPSGFAPLTPGPPAGAFGAPAPGPQAPADPANPWSAPADQGFAGPPSAGPGGYTGPPGYGVPPGPPGYPGHPGYPGYPGYPGAVPEKSNGLAVASLVLGLIAVLVALIPFFFWLGTLIGLTGLGLGIAAVVSASRGAPRKAMSWWGTVLGVLSLFASVAGFYFTVKVADKVDRAVDSRPGRSWDEPYPTPSFSSPYGLPGDEPTTGPGFSTPLAFGESHTYANGLKVSLSTPVEYVSKSHADIDNAVKFDITITNTSKKPITVIYLQPDVTDERGRSAETVFDGYMPKAISQTVAPGATATGSSAYEVPKGTKTLRAEISPALLLDPVKFAGPIG
ncbi:DUF4352 domain-containing protein [Streptomyces sp. NPDC002602]|uniref:DUF4352 domain-containing protein n=1 Tax=Streptomyces sp. NPDC002602 TaxID=3364654 RepID=UPI003684584E